MKEGVGERKRTINCIKLKTKWFLRGAFHSSFHYIIIIFINSIAVLTKHDM